MNRKDTLIASSNSLFLIQSGPSETNAALEFAVNTLLVRICFTYIVQGMIYLLYNASIHLYVTIIKEYWLQIYNNIKSHDNYNNFLRKVEFKEWSMEN